jgi:hypothetical protein
VGEVDEPHPATATHAASTTHAWIVRYRGQTGTMAAAEASFGPRRVRHTFVTQRRSREIPWKSPRAVAGVCAT